MSSSTLLEPATPETIDQTSLSHAQPRTVLPASIDRVVLTGFMGSGKTTAGKLLADRLGWAFRDLDGEIQRREGRTVPQIFAESGEAVFRRLESGALASLLGQRNIVIALGGGAPEELGNRLLLEQTPHTTVVYLKAPLATLLDRCAQDRVNERPLLAEAEARFARRHPLYERIAGHRVTTTDLAADAVADAILIALQR